MSNMSAWVTVCIVADIWHACFLTHLVEMVSNDLPDAGPLQADAVHVVVGDLHYLL